MLNARLVEKGKQFSLSAMTQQGRVLHGHAEEHLAELTPRGWTADDNASLGTNLGTLESAAADRDRVREDAKSLTLDEGALRSDGKILCRAIREMAWLVLKDGPVDGVTYEQFSMKGGRLESTREVLEYLKHLSTRVAPLDAPLARYFGGQKASELALEAWQRLRDADVSQEKTRAELPAETVALLELKGRVLDQIETLNAIARVTFEGQAEIRAKFNKDLLHRGRSTKTRTEPATPPIA